MADNPNALRDAIVRAYDSMPRERWHAFEAYCAANHVSASLLSFIGYLLVCADRCENRRYLVFASQDYYPAGGWGDFVGAFGTVAEAVAAEAASERNGLYAHVIDLETMADLSDSQRANAVASAPAARSSDRIDP